MFTPSNGDVLVVFKTDPKVHWDRSFDKKARWIRESVEESLKMFRQAGFLVPGFIVVSQSVFSSTSVAFKNYDLSMSFTDFFNSAGKSYSEKVYKGIVFHEIGHIVLNWNLEHYAPHFTVQFKYHFQRYSDLEHKKEAFRLFELSRSYHELVADVAWLYSDAIRNFDLPSNFFNLEQGRYRRFHSKFPLPWDERTYRPPWEEQNPPLSDNFKKLDSLNLKMSPQDPYIRLAQVRRFIIRTHFPREIVLQMLFQSIGRELDELIELNEPVTDRTLNARLIEKLKRAASEHH